MNIYKQLLTLLILSSIAFSCSPMRGTKAVLVDDDGRSMRFDNGRAESRNKKWNSDKSLHKQRKKRDKAFRKRRRG